MKLSSDLLARWLQGSGKQPGIDALARQDINVPNQLAAVVEVVGAIPHFAGVATTDVQRDSCLASLSVTTAPLAATIVRPFLGLGRGLWKIFCNLDACADYDAHNSFIGALLLTDPPGTGQRICTALGGANHPQHITTSFNLMLQDDGWFFSLSSGATGAGQSHTASVSVYAQRLN